MFGPLASILPKIAGPLVSGLFGRRSTTQKTVSKPDLVGLVAEAQEAGFNPLTALKAGAAGGTTMTTLPGLSSAEFIGDALNRGLTAFSEQEDDALQREMDVLSRDILREELRQLQSQGRAIAPTQSFGYAVPQATTYGGNDVSNPVVDDTGAGGAGGAGDGVGGNYRVFGWELAPSPLFSNAQEIEDRHGDLVSAVYGGATIPADIWHTLTTNYGSETPPPPRPQNVDMPAPFEARTPMRTTMVARNARDGYVHSTGRAYPENTGRAPDPRMDVWRAGNYGPEYEVPFWR